MGNYIDPLTCCALGLCCDAGSAEQEVAFLKVLTDHFKGDADKAAKVVAKMRDDLVKFSEKLSKECEDAH